MSMNRRVRAMVNRERTAQERQAWRERRAEIYAGPAGTWNHDPDVLVFSGAETKIYNAAGQVAWSQKRSDFLLGRRQYARIITSAPLAFSARVRAKRTR